ncbi:hypothetical protein [Sorangium sp. So ce204]|uniref:hypothetical protein n=1 Tax=Sorangium sp. So ce204 TaxID=3133288 RepID=UPI003F5F5E43
MAKQDGEAAGVPRAIQSQGEDEAKAYAVGEVAPGPLHPTVEMERVHIEDPRRVPPPREGARRGGGARNPEQRAPLSDAGAPSVSMPEGLSVTKRQPIVIDSEILAEWHGGRGEAAGSEAAGGEAAGGEAAGRDEATGSAGRAAPRLAEVAVARRTERRAGRQRAAWVLALGILLAIGAAVVRTGWGARDGGAETARGAGGAAQGEEKDRRGEEKAGTRGDEKASVSGAATASAPAASAPEGPVEAPGGAAVSVRTPPPVEGAPAAATSALEGRSSGPAGSATSQGAAPRARAGGPAAPTREAPREPAGAASARATPGAPQRPSAYDVPNFD